MIEVAKVLVESLILVLIVIFAFVGSVRATIIPAVTIPVAIISAFIAMAALDYTINTLTLLGLVLAIGLVVDDAIVVLENIVRQMELGKTAAAGRRRRQPGDRLRRRRHDDRAGGRVRADLLHAGQPGPAVRRVRALAGRRHRLLRPGGAHAGAHAHVQVLRQRHPPGPACRRASMRFFKRADGALPGLPGALRAAPLDRRGAARAPRRRPGPGSTASCPASTRPPRTAT